MASESRLFALSAGDQKQIRDFRLKGSKLGTAYLSFSITKSTHEVTAATGGVVAIEDVDELVDALPDNTPRYVLVSYDLQYPDGRRATPLFLLYWSPRTASTQMATLYVSPPRPPANP
ncbi:Cofilin/tropomyosin family protein [Taphrina deformans PYCC 5710]|uniref:Cofilin/tropomyosin family protein n=1 Tax=Taphrina deformans (strain PYCC 5710 / ATCC 11124 / CBS 356.35 / IMI 108563 / JCM 9778 / NBRC 8474) TaxID=1097556 RepID=R4X916_TAPDE|nr:Cofilin/tropomyosin family protein [Taphrina deformans PYCC 5710]|eukprot:CCG82169.1 Cofilin/tropomyosin family protein [Taphrina deformans PYCC 5710]